MRSVFFLPVLAGCAVTPQPPLLSAWYLQYKAETNAQVEVALLNRSAVDVEFTKVVLNRADCDGGPSWRRTKAFSIAPGEVVVLKTSKFDYRPGIPCHPGGAVSTRVGAKFDKACMVPVSVAVRLGPASRPLMEQRYAVHLFGKHRDYLHVDLVGRMPSALPDSWESCPKPSGRDIQ